MDLNMGIHGPQEAYTGTYMDSMEININISSASFFLLRGHAHCKILHKYCIFQVLYAF